ncbi:hypothetical protein VSR01_28345 [Actinacidiphila sp. DG2A-62]|nr:hypothetical protein [Actinacidiphila sp. DG2A-62]MEC3997201.1 hypothetical protein [Actinacidiphila sp. DG2A-62]
MTLHDVTIVDLEAELAAVGLAPVPAAPIGHTGGDASSQQISPG